MLILILLASLFVTLALGFFVLVSAPHRAVNRTFALFIGMMSLWIVKDLAFWGFHAPTEDAGWWAMASFFIGLTLQIVFLHFAEVFPENAPPHWRRIVLVSLPLLVFLPLLFAGEFWTRARFQENHFSIALTPYAYAAGVYNTLMLGWGMAILWGKYTRHKGTLWGNQIASVIAAMLVTGVLMVASGNLMPALGQYSFLPYGSDFIVAGALIYAYAISNFKLFSLQTALDQLRLFPIAYKVAIAVATTGLFGFFLCELPVALWAFGAQGPGWRKFLVFSAIAGMVPSLALVLLIVRILSRPLREMAEVALDVSRGNYGAETAISSNDELGVLASSFNTMSRKMAEDIAQLKQINQAMVQTEKLATAGSLAASVAHEVNNPLAAISSLVQSLLARAADERDRETLRLIVSQITRISGVLRDLMDFARPQAPAPRPTDLNQVLKKSIELASYDKRFKRLAIRTEFSPLPALELDPDRMQQVFLNLLLNARDAIGEDTEDGQIVISTSAPDDQVLAQIADNGSGIAPELLPRIFDPFITTKTKGQGTGLGLAVCHSIIAAQGGRIGATNRERGSVFTVIFPKA